MRRTTSTEFTRWMWFFEKKKDIKFNDEMRAFRRIDHYLAQIAMEVYRASLVAEDRDKPTIEQFMLKFHPKGTPKEIDITKPRELTEKEKKEKIERSKNYWCSMFGIQRKPKNE